jgi:hypothetical protein
MDPSRGDRRALRSPCFDLTVAWLIAGERFTESNSADRFKSYTESRQCVLFIFVILAIYDIFVIVAVFDIFVVLAIYAPVYIQIVLMLQNVAQWLVCVWNCCW